MIWWYMYQMIQFLSLNCTLLSNIPVCINMSINLQPSVIVTVKEVTIKEVP